MNYIRNLYKNCSFFVTVEQLSTSNISSTCPTGVNYISKYAGDLREKSHEVWTRNSNRSRCTAKKMTGGGPLWPPPMGLGLIGKALHKKQLLLFLLFKIITNTIHSFLPPTGQPPASHPDAMGQPHHGLVRLAGLGHRDAHPDPPPAQALRPHQAPYIQNYDEEHYRSCWLPAYYHIYYSICRWVSCFSFYGGVNWIKLILSVESQKDIVTIQRCRVHYTCSSCAIKCPITAMFHWEPEGHYCCTKSISINTLSFHSGDKINFCQLSARRALLLFNDVSLRITRALSLYKVYQR